MWYGTFTSDSMPEINCELEVQSLVVLCDIHSNHGDEAGSRRKGMKSKGEWSESWTCLQIVV